jgi:hypothetical protein
MTTETDTPTDLDELAAAATSVRGNDGNDVNKTLTRGRVPSPRVLRAGGLVLRAAGALIIIASFWPLIWTAVEAFLLFSGAIKSEWHFTVSDKAFFFRLRGWPAILFGIIWTVSLWCAATIAIALGHALYAIRDVLMHRNT